jgi:hypothetical protein
MRLTNKTTRSSVILIGIAIIIFVIYYLYFRIPGTEIPFTALSRGSFLRNSRTAGVTPELIIIQDINDVSRIENSKEFTLPSYVIPEEKNRVFSSLRAVDYNQFLALFVFQGSKSHSGYDVIVDDVYFSENNVNVYATFHTPDKWYNVFFGEQVESPMSEDPYQIITIRSDLLRGKTVTFNLIVREAIVYKQEIKINWFSYTLDYCAYLSRGALVAISGRTFIMTRSSFRIIILVLTAVVLLNLNITARAQMANEQGLPNINRQSIFAHLAIEHVSKAQGIPASTLFVFEDTEVRSDILAKTFQFVTIIDKSSFQPYKLMIEHDTRAVHSANDVELAEKKTRVERFGKLDPALFNHLQGLSNSDVVSATIILEIQPGAALSDLELEVTNELSQKYPEVRNAVANNRSPMDVPDVALSHKIRAEYLSGITNRVQQRVNAFLQILEARRIQYTPFAGMPAVIVTATKAQLIQLAQHPSVGNVFLANSDKVVLAAPSSMPTRSVSNGHHTASNIEAVWALGYKGSGTSVAVLDSSVADTSSVSSHCPDLNGANNCFLNLGGVYPFFSLITDHATAIAGVVASNAVYPDAPNETLGIAPLTTIHRGGTISGTSEQVVQALDWALFTSLVDVASASVVTYSSTGTPSSFAWAFDYQARLAQRTVVAAAGNNGDYVASPGAGWNSLVVGGYHHETSTMWENDLKGEASSWKNPSTGAEKPDVVAPAFANFLNVGGNFSNSDGTSLSAPHVAAVVA